MVENSNHRGTLKKKGMARRYSLQRIGMNSVFTKKTTRFIFQTGGGWSQRLSWRRARQMAGRWFRSPATRVVRPAGRKSHVGHFSSPNRRMMDAPAPAFLRPDREEPGRMEKLRLHASISLACRPRKAWLFFRFQR